MDQLDQSLGTDCVQNSFCWKKNDKIRSVDLWLSSSDQTDLSSHTWFLLFDFNPARIKRMAG